jgi:hypothetical protein
MLIRPSGRNPGGDEWRSCGREPRPRLDDADVWPGTASRYALVAFSQNSAHSCPFQHIRGLNTHSQVSH